jgi:ATP-dependent DNA helicase RecG
LKLADLARDGQIVGIAREAARSILLDDPNFEKPEHSYLRAELKRLLKSKPNWGKIS